MYKTPEYAAWQKAKGRCYNPKDAKYPLYGGRGIRMCDRWLHSFENFLEDMGPRTGGTTLDRFPNVNGNYEPGNCRWATPRQQANNVRHNVRVEMTDGRTITLKEAARECGVDYSSLHRAVQYRGRDPLTALTEMIRRRNGRHG